MPRWRRAINAAAGLSPAALHYPFGTKEGLVGAILLRRMPELMARRGALLDQLAASSDSPDAPAVVDAFLRPLVELLLGEPEAGRRYIRFLARAFADGDVDTLDLLTNEKSDHVISSNGTDATASSLPRPTRWTSTRMPSSMFWI